MSERMDVSRKPLVKLKAELQHMRQHQVTLLVKRTLPLQHPSTKSILSSNISVRNATATFRLVDVE